jgi:hypothetical protein
MSGNLRGLGTLGLLRVAGFVGSGAGNLRSFGMLGLPRLSGVPVGASGNLRALGPWGFGGVAGFAGAVSRGNLFAWRGAANIWHAPASEG